MRWLDSPCALIACAAICLLPPPACPCADNKQEVELPPPALVKPQELWTGKQLFSLMLRPK